MGKKKQSKQKGFRVCGWGRRGGHTSSKKEKLGGKSGGYNVQKADFSPEKKEVGVRERGGCSRGKEKEKKNPTRMKGRHWGGKKIGGLALGAVTPFSMREKKVIEGFPENGHSPKA